MSADSSSSTDSSRSRETVIDADLTGRQLGDYRLLRRLGRGGMADVYLAEQASLQRQVAFKVLRADLAKDENYVKRFHREAQAAAKLVHANIVQIYEVGEIEGVNFIAQEYVQGKNLREYLDRHGALDVRLAVLIMRQMSAALFRAAQQGIVHRDIKPENVLITGTGEVKVADFGLARVVREGQELNLTQAGVTMGTPLYMSPEQAEGKPLDHRSDLYSLGVTCYHMLAGQPPFRGETALSVAVQHVKSPAASLEKVRPDLPEALCRIVHRLLEKNPKNRYESARDLLRDLRMLPVPGLDELGPDDELWQILGAELAGPLEASRRLDSVMKTAALELKRPSRRWGWWAAAAAAGLLVAAGIAWFTRGPSLLQELGAAELEIPRQKTAQAQFVYVSLLEDRTKAHWQSVVDFQPAESLYSHMAKKELALLSLLENDYASAEAVFKELADLGSEPDFSAFGLAGLCVIHTVRAQHKEAVDLVSKLRKVLNPGTLDRRMQEMLWPALRTSYAARQQEWDHWAEERFGLDAAYPRPSGASAKQEGPRAGMLLAKKELAIISLYEKDYKAAENYFNEIAEMAAVDDSEQEHRAFGLAGQCLMHSFNGRHQDSVDAFAELRPLLVRGLLDRRLQDPLWAALRASYAALDQKWDNWTEEAFGHGAEDPSPLLPRKSDDAKTQPAKAKPKVAPRERKSEKSA